MKLLGIPVLLYAVYVLHNVDLMVAESLLQTIPTLWNELNEIFSLNAFEKHKRMMWQFEKAPSTPPSASNILADAKALVNLIYKVDYEAFGSDEGYLILSQDLGGGGFQERWLIFYYVGNNMPTDRREAVAEYAMKMYSILAKYKEIDVQFTRELIGYETPLLQEVLECFLNHKRPPTSSLYLVKGDEVNVGIVKVPLSSGWLNENNNYCLVLEFNRHSQETPPHVYCPSRTTKLEKTTAKKLAVELLGYSGYYDREQVMYFETDNNSSGSLVHELLSRWVFYAKAHAPNQHDIRRIASTIDETFVKYLNEAITLYRINGEKLEKIRTGPLTFDLLKNDECYVVDSSSFGGLFVVVGQQTSLPSRIKAMQVLEKTLDSDYDPKTLVTITELGKDLVDLKINFVGWSHIPNVPLDPNTGEYFPQVIHYE